MRQNSQGVIETTLLELVDALSTSAEDDREVVAYDGVHGAAKEQRGDVLLDAGAHQLRVEFFQGGGGQVLDLAYAGPGGERVKLATRKQAPARVTPIDVVPPRLIERPGSASRRTACSAVVFCPPSS